MKKIMTLMLGMAFLFATVAPAFSQEPPKKEEPKKKSKGKSKKNKKQEEPKKG